MSIPKNLAVVALSSAAVVVVLAVAAAATVDPDEFAELGPFLRQRLPAVLGVVIVAATLAWAGATWLRRSGRGGVHTPAVWVAAVLVSPVVVLLAWMIFGSDGDF